MSETTTLHQFCIAIAGNPNSGKTTLFNQLTGLRQKVGNYPGVTVEKKLGVHTHLGKHNLLLDLPGIYGLSPRSEEERIATEIIKGQMADTPAIQGVLCVLDSTCLERSLYLPLQLIQSGLPVALLLNMTDELDRRGAEIAVKKLSALLDVPVIQISAIKGTGLDEVRDLIHQWSTYPPIPGAKINLGGSDEKEILARRKKAKALCIEVLRKKVQTHPWSDKIDNVVMHKVYGPLVFVGVVLVVFQAIFSWATPFMDLIDSLFSALSTAVRNNLPDTIMTSFLADGIISGVGSVIIFLPQILIVFFFISLLENSGYMARAAMVMDRLFSRIGLQGKSFLPLISSYACAVPGIMATRTIENKRDRLATILIAPLMTCSARLPVYALLIAAFIPDTPVIKGLIGLKAVTLLGLYLIGFLAAIATAFVLKSSILKSSKVPFILDIPPYRIPSGKTLLLLMWDRSRIFLRRAGTVILGTSIIIWFLMSFPRTEAAPQLRDSYAGQIGIAIEPLIKPLGFNWKIGVGLVAAQAAREVIISTLSTIYNLEETGDTTVNLQEAIKKDLTPLGAMSLLVFFVFAMQCMSTMAIAKRETGGWKIPIIMFTYMNVYAYLASLLVYQGGLLLGFH